MTAVAKYPRDAPEFAGYLDSVAGHHDLPRAGWQGAEKDESTSHNLIMIGLIDSPTLRAARDAITRWCAQFPGWVPGDSEMAGKAWSVADGVVPDSPNTISVHGMGEVVYGRKNALCWLNATVRTDR